MARNIVLLVSTTAVLIILFVGYVQLVRVPDIEQTERHAVVDELPDQAQLAGDETVQIGPAEISGGKGVDYTVYDERGRPIRRFRCNTWKPVPDAKNEVFVEQPELTMLLPSGMVAVVSAKEGQITADRIEKSSIRPSAGWLRGDARIVIDTATTRERTPASERPADLITIAMERLDFDLDLGELRTDGAFTAVGTEFDIAGEGIKLVWNQADNRVETLVVARGRELMLYVEGGVFGGLGGSAGQASEEDVAAATTQSTRPAVTPRRTKKRTAYACTLSGQVVAEHRRGDELLGGLEGDELRLLFDVGGEAGRILGRDRTTASQPTDEPREKLVVRWNGPLTLGPAPPPRNDQEPRRRFVAVGQPVRLSRGEGTVTCGRLEYYDETGQIWLHPDASGRVDFAMRTDLAATASSVYVDQAHHVVKLIGDVVLEARRNEQAGGQPVGIRCTHWAELHLDPRTDVAATEDVIQSGGLKSATFVGEVRAQLIDEALSAHQLDLHFRPAEGDEPLEALLTSAVAMGDVELAAPDRRLTCGRAEITFDTNDQGRRYPRALDAVGTVVITHERGRLRGNRVLAQLEPWQPDPQKPEVSPALRTLEVFGEAALDGLDNADTKVVARGAHIFAAFVGANELTRAIVSGTAEEHALAYYEPYAVRGRRIELSAAEQTLHVDGRSKLTFRTRRGLRGQRSRRSLPIEVVSHDVLHIDGRGNTVYFAGNVTATRERERLRGDTLTLLLEDVAPPPVASQPAEEPPLTAYWRRLEQMFLARSGRQAESGLGFFGLGAEGEAERMNKEPLRLLARNAVVESEVRDPNDPQPLMHSSIAAPELEADLRQRIIHTRGETTLLMTDRRWPDERAAKDTTTFGLPSAMMTRGPSQTAMSCDQGLTYAVGADEPNAQDHVLFEGNVVFRHVAGREMVNLELMLPDVLNQPTLLEQLEDRNTFMQCARLECGFAEGRDTASTRAGGGELTKLRLSWLMATGNVYLRDQQQSLSRTVYADQLEFDRSRGLVRVLGGQSAPARIYTENSQTGQLDLPWMGKDLIYDLGTNTIRATEGRGELRRP